MIQIYEFKYLRFPLKILTHILFHLNLGSLMLFYYSLV